MNATAAFSIAALIVLLALVHVPFGEYMARVYTSQKHSAIERVTYRVLGVNPDSNQRWPIYLRALIIFSILSVVALYALLRLQPYLPWSNGESGMPALQSFNTAVSFMTNTNWQSYSGETVGFLAQMAGLTVQNFLSAAIGMAVAVAFIRGLAARGSDRLGNFWVDLVRGTFRILLPLAFIFAIVLMISGVIQNLSDTTVTTLTGGNQLLPGGAVASQEAIKELGTNGGGAFNANSAHPFENPTPLTNFIEIFLLLVIPFSLPRTFGRMVGAPKQGYSVVAAMTSIWALSTAAVIWFQNASGGTALAAGAAMEGQEVRFGIPMSSVFAASTTLTSTGATFR